MKARFLRAWTACLIVGFVAVPAFSHHGTSSYYNGERVTLKGVVTQVDWINPHAFVYIDVKNENGTIENWAIEGSGGPAGLERRGWTKESLKPGTVIVVTGSLPGETVRLTKSLAYDPLAVSHLQASRLMQARDVTLPNGETRVFGMAPQ